MRNVTLFTIAAVGALALLFAACGDDDDAARGETDTQAASNGGAFVGFDGDDSAGEALESRAVTSDAVGAFPAAPPSADGATSADILGRTIIRNGSVALEVESVAESFEAVRSVATANGGFVADSTFYGGSSATDEDDGSRFASLTLRVPSERFEQVVADLRALAIEVTSISTSSQDVTGEVTDLESDLRNLRAVESQYLELLGRADAIGEVLQVQDRLNQTRSQIERIEGRLALLESLADLATLRVELRTPLAPVVAEAGDSGPLDAARAGWEASLATLSAIASVGLAVAVFSWWLLPVVAVVLLALRRWGTPARLARATMDTSRGNT
jgi:hypothetical protein